VAEHPVVYVIEDDEAIRESLRLLIECEGYRVSTYRSGAAFLDEASPEDNSCILVDVHMPGLSGVDMLERLRENGMLIPAIVMTGMPDAGIRQAVRRLGAFLLEKPFRDGALMLLIARALGREGQA
jgi:two-component system, LuxR family, response regulator FixJ